MYMYMYIYIIYYYHYSAVKQWNILSSNLVSAMEYIVY